MSNQDKAARIVGKTLSRWDMDGRPDIPGGIDALIAKELADAGLLMPDLPEPDKNSSTGTSVWWEKGTLGVTVYPGGEIGMMIEWDEEARYTAATAQAQALVLLAAAEHAEEEA